MRGDDFLVCLGTCHFAPAFCVVVVFDVSVTEL